MRKSLTVYIYLRNATKKDPLKTVKGYLKGIACISLHGSLFLSGKSKRLVERFYTLVSGFRKDPSPTSFWVIQNRQMKMVGPVGTDSSRPCTESTADQDVIHRSLQNVVLFYVCYDKRFSLSIHWRNMREFQYSRSECVCGVNLCDAAL